MELRAVEHCRTWAGGVLIHVKHDKEKKDFYEGQRLALVVDLLELRREKAMFEERYLPRRYRAQHYDSKATYSDEDDTDNSERMTSARYSARLQETEKRDKKSKSMSRNWRTLVHLNLPPATVMPQMPATSPRTSSISFHCIPPTAMTKTKISKAWQTSFHQPVCRA